MKNTQLKIGLVFLLIFFAIKSFLIDSSLGGAIIFGAPALMFLLVGLCYTAVGLLRLKNKVPETQITKTGKPFSRPFVVVVLVSLVIFFLSWVLLVNYF